MMSPSEPTKLMLSRAIASSLRHGIKLIPGRLNEGAGNCSFESVLFNNNDRSCFQDRYSLSSDYYRRIWMTDMKAKVLDNLHSEVGNWNLGYTNDQIEKGFDEVKESGVYERGLFGDLILPGIAVGIHKLILIFNTDVNTPHDPISVISPDAFGGFKDSCIPIVLAYNGVHFESMHPVQNEDIEATKDLANSYLEGHYPYNHGDVPNLIELESSESNADISPEEVVDLDGNSFSFLSNKKRYVISMDDNGFMQCPICEKSFQRIKPHLKNKQACSAFIDFESFNTSFELFDSNLKRAKGREKSAATRKRRQEELSEEEKKKNNEAEAKRKREARKKQTQEEKEKINEANAKRNNETRKNQTQDKIRRQNDGNAKRNKVARENQTQENKWRQNLADAEKKKSRMNAKENAPLAGIARRFTVDNPYFHDIIESCEGPLKVWCKGEKLEHDVFWQKITAERFVKRLNEAYEADKLTETAKGFLEYVLNPQSQGYKDNEWTIFVMTMKKIQRKFWNDEMYTLLTRPRDMAKMRQISQDVLEETAELRKIAGVEYQKPVFNKGPVCPCFARKFFLEVSYLGCCST